MVHASVWYLLLSVVGWLTFPLAYRLLPGLRDRGTALLRPLGLLLWSFIFWLLASLQLLQNTSGGLLVAFIMMAGLSAWAGWGKGDEMRGWLRQYRGTILAFEGLMLGAFIAWATVRAANPDIQYFEKTMEMAFISGILRSDTFPPIDPWLSGYSISYYYFGYVMVAALAKLSGTPGPIAFNLAHASWFAMSATAAYGILYNLLARYFADSLRGLRRWALLAPLFLLLVSNLEGFLGVLHARGLFWQATADGSVQSQFWTWLGISDLNQPPAQPYGWQPHQGVWDPSWRASRVLTDMRFDGTPVEIIDEFPFFSYLLGDLHPHVLSMPFALLAIALALNYYTLANNRSVMPLSWRSWLKTPHFWLAAIALGGLAFLNTWDFPMYVALFAGAGALAAQNRSSGFRWKHALIDFVRTGVLVGIAGVLLYLPFYLGFSSQAGGVLPSGVFHTPGKTFWVMFAPLLLPIFGWLVFMLRRDRSIAPGHGIKAAAAVLLLLWVGSLLFGAGLLSLVGLGERMTADGSSMMATVGDASLRAGRAFQHDVQGAGNAPAQTVIMEGLRRRIVSPGAWLTLFALAAGGIGIMAVRARTDPARAQIRYEKQTLGSMVVPEDHRAVRFVAWMIVLGALLALVPEFFYLRDQFGTRMNTIFKFYIQVWVLWSIVAAYASAILLRQLQGTGGFFFRLGWVLLLAASLAYPLFMLPVKTQQLRPSAWTLDGSRYLDQIDPAMTQAIAWLRAAPTGVLAEGVSGSYSYHIPRYSVFSGQPAVLGWPGHESQWGRTTELGTRQSDMQQLFTTRDWEEALPVLERYGIRYIVVGPVERSVYGDSTQGPVLDDSKFRSRLPVVFEQPNITIYEVPKPIADTSIAR